MSPLHVRSKVCMGPFNVRSKVCIAPIHWQSKFVDFTPHVEGTNADLFSGSRKYLKLLFLPNFFKKIKTPIFKEFIWPMWILLIIKIFWGRVPLPRTCDTSIFLLYFQHSVTWISSSISYFVQIHIVLTYFNWHFKLICIFVIFNDCSPTLFFWCIRIFGDINFFCCWIFWFFL